MNMYNYNYIIVNSDILVESQKISAAMCIALHIDSVFSLICIISNILCRITDFREFTRITCSVQQLSQRSSSPVFSVDAKHVLI